MDILYLTLSDPDIHSTGIYADLVNALRDKGHRITIVYADDPDVTRETNLKQEAEGIEMLRVRCGKVFGVNFIVKGINTLRVEPLLKAAISKHLFDRHYDIVIYATPPVTFANVISYCKRKYNCKALLMLKDIFPQNAIDLGLFKENGPIHKLFRHKEKALYRISDVIGCMSNMNRQYILEHNPEIDEKKCIVFPNTIDVKKALLKQNTGIPDTEGAGDTEKTGDNKRAADAENTRNNGSGKNNTVKFVFGGNLGKPQAIDFLIDAISQERVANNKNAEFLFIGNGSETEKVRSACERLSNAEFRDFLPPMEYNRIMNSCDVGIISLDHRFTIPNYPSRTLGYMSMKKPVLAVTDRNTDIRELVEKEACFGKWCPSDNFQAFADTVEWFCNNKDSLKAMGQSGFDYLNENFDVKRSVELIEKYSR